MYDNKVSIEFRISSPNTDTVDNFVYTAIYKYMHLSIFLYIHPSIYVSNFWTLYYCYQSWSRFNCSTAQNYLLSLESSTFLLLLPFQYTLL